VDARTPAVWRNAYQPRQHLKEIKRRTFYHESSKRPHHAATFFQETLTDWLLYSGAGASGAVKRCYHSNIQLESEIL
jgi:hypothetical protein